MIRFVAGAAALALVACASTDDGSGDSHQIDAMVSPGADGAVAGDAQLSLPDGGGTPRPDAAMACTANEQCPLAGTCCLMGIGGMSDVGQCVEGVITGSGQCLPAV